jgi:regulator of replication initiation timing
MTLSQIAETLKHLNIHPNEIADERLAEASRIMLQLIEELYEENEKLKVENQKLRDAINLLKGEQTKPDIKSSGKKPNNDISSEEERKASNISKKKKLKAKKHKIYLDNFRIFISPASISRVITKYKRLTYLQALCWVHDGRNYKKLRPVVPEHSEKLWMSGLKRVRLKSRSS